MQQQETRLGRGMTLDERAQLETQAFNDLVSDVLLNQEYEKRGIRVTDDEIINAAKTSPPPDFANAPELQTDGQFDPSKYARFLSSPSARQQGMLARLETFYRMELPKQKLYNQVAGDIFVPDTRLWQVWRDAHDSATVSSVKFEPLSTKEITDAVTEADMQKYYDTHAKDFDRPARASISPSWRSAANRRAPIPPRRSRRFRRFVLKSRRARSSKMSQSASPMTPVSGKEGGKLPMSAKGTYVGAFEKMPHTNSRLASSSQPVLTPLRLSHHSSRRAQGRLRSADAPHPEVHQAG